MQKLGWRRQNIQPKRVCEREKNKIKCQLNYQKIVISVCVCQTSSKYCINAVKKLRIDHFLYWKRCGLLSPGLICFSEEMIADTAPDPACTTGPLLGVGLRNPLCLQRRDVLKPKCTIFVKLFYDFITQNDFLINN